MTRILHSLLIALVLIGCTPRGEFLKLDQLPPDKAALTQTEGLREVVFVGTTRTKVNGEFGFKRSEQASFLRYDIYVPRNRQTGEVVWPKNARTADPKVDFLTLADQQYKDGTEFKHALRDRMKLRKQQDVVIYVHGFNNTMAEGIYRVAQMHYDLQVPGIAVHYAWPSRGSPLAYVYDRDSAIFARNGLEELLNEVAEAGAKRIIIVAHSMGSAVAMETLRQVAIRDDRHVLNAIKGVVLISPDLDVDVFRSQVRDMGKLPEAFLIFGSSKDKILGISSRLSGNPARLGNLKDLSKIADLKVTYLDTTAYNVGAGHFNLGTSPALIKLLGGIANVNAAFEAEAKHRVGLLPGAVLTLQNATAVILSPVTAVVNQQ